ncbi:MAG TPA: twin-arginine translocase TatA/TatE family subunit [Actinomycetota bacterium]|nr:twin-arginine translocase TatA/TatE family subunit [Actinomycetota bacterium]
MGNISPTEILLVAGVIILLFGAKKLPEIARSLGKAKGEFKQGLQEGDAVAPPTDKPTEPAE